MFKRGLYWAKRVRGSRSLLLVGQVRPKARGRARGASAGVEAQVGLTEAAGGALAYIVGAGSAAEVGQVRARGRASVQTEGVAARSVVVFFRRWPKRGRSSVSVRASKRVGAR